MSILVKNSLIKVTFNHILSNGKNACWFKVKSSALSYVVSYWRKKDDFFYLKIYAKNDDGSCGPQTGYITKTAYSYTP